MHAHVDHRIAALARAQHGVAARHQLRSIGVTDRAISHRLAAGRLHRVHRGVFAVGHEALSWRGRCMAAVLAVGGDAVVDGRMAARLHGAARPSWRAARRMRTITVLTTRNVRASHAGIRIRRTRHLPDEDRACIDGIPVVAPARLLVSLAAVETVTVLCKLIDELAYRSAFDAAATERCMARLHARNGCGHARLQDALARYAHGEHGSDSEFEERGLAWVTSLGVPIPACNVYVTAGGERMRIDVAWESIQVAVEFDGVGHARPSRRRQDLRRRTALRDDGWYLLIMTRERFMDPDERARYGRRLARVIQRRLRAPSHARAGMDASRA